MVFEKEAAVAGFDVKELSRVISRLSRVMKDLGRLGLSVDELGFLIFNGDRDDDGRPLVVGSSSSCRFESGTAVPDVASDGFLRMVWS